MLTMPLDNETNGGNCFVRADLLSNSITGDPF